MRKRVLGGLLAVVLLAACNRSPVRAPTTAPSPVPGMPTSAPVLITPVPSGEPEATGPATEALSPAPPAPSATPIATPAGPKLASPSPALAAATTVAPIQRITIARPGPGAALASGAQVTGQVSLVPPEKTLAYRVYAPDGRVIGRGSLIVNGAPGQPGEYSGAVRFAAPARQGAGQLEVLEQNPEDGSVLSSAWTNVGFGRALTPAGEEPPAITIEWPLPGVTLAPGDEALGGISPVPLKDQVVYRVYDQAGRLLGSGPVKVEAEAEHGSFAAPVNYAAEVSGPGRVVILDQSHDDGRWLAAAFADIVLLPATAAEANATPGVAGGASSGRTQPRGGLPLPTAVPTTSGP